MNIIKKYIEFILEKRISANMPIPNDVLAIAKAYKLAGKDLFIVGGAVRDHLQGKAPHDYDLVTNALPEESKRILKDFNVSDEQGKNFGVLRVYTEDEPLGHEIASYRKDISGGRDTKGDEPKVELGSHITIEDDVKRRDITCNALFYDIDKKEIVDLVGGVDDIKNGVIRAVGDALERFKEDRLRILRVLRFAARTGGKIDPMTSDAIKKDNRLVGIGPKDDVSMERIWGNKDGEIVKAWQNAKHNYVTYLNYFTEFDLWSQVLPGVKVNTDIVECDSFYCYLANILINIDTTSIKGAESSLVEKYKIDGDTASIAVFLIHLLELDQDNVFDMYKSKIRSGVSEATILEWYKVNNISKVHISGFYKFLKYKPSVSADELMSQGFKGKPLGDEINRLEVLAFKNMKY